VNSRTDAVLNGVKEKLRLKGRYPKAPNAIRRSLILEVAENA
jgi:hypothetical protein